MAEKRYWLLKSDPDAFSIEDLAGSPHQTTCWDGVRNYQARNFMRDDMKVGDGVLFYHSQAHPAIMGTARVVREGYPDHTAWEPGNRHFDPRSTPENPVWYMVDIQLEAVFPEPLPLKVLKETGGLEEMVLLRKGSRLSVQPVTASEYERVLELAHLKENPAMTGGMPVVEKQPLQKENTMAADALLKNGDPAPDFSLASSEGKDVRLSDYRGKYVVLYFYPKDNTSGCTTEALEFTELQPELERLQTVVLGVSKDSVESHQKFVEKQGLKILLLSDPDKKVLESYGAWQLKKMYGKESWGVVRSTFLVGPDGRIVQSWPKVAKAAGHAAKVLEELKARQAG
ncbi:EVE domain-containing protein [Desulforhabdus sp. TSK]|uniref:EVE domain-containing protein n=1 Tax=Desulforhabdus sp. TSK TaxID=2925014 RepID=UPI001FC8950D|nr:EVE domain-containing protein [Desulforhabdus sp. TSK]GKT10638.1 hypothetical protein DSTSK_39430 [Desulforhabdus sp. TSK]